MDKDSVSLANKEKKKLNLKSEYEEICDRATEASQEDLNLLTWKIQELYYKLTIDTRKNSIQGSEDIHINSNGGIVVIQSEKFEENGVIVKKILIPTNHKFLKLEEFESSDEIIDEFSSSAEESDVQDEIPTQSKLEDFEENLFNS